MKKLILRAINDNSLPSPSSYGSESVATLYFVLTASDVVVERFCMNSCGFHDSTVTSVNPRISHHSSLSMPYAWVGNPATQCPGLCAWPFAKPEYGPPTPPLLPPNQDIGMDGMMINIATILAGAATNPFNSGYFQGDPSAPLEASTACVGSFGPGSYPGYPGNLQADKRTKASYNVIGANRREYLLPAVWSPLTETCKPPQS
ncbi:hypothetical protein KP509_04G084300 [Ceratopteris richardii]|nr:hypothetical protein KP509_04G084300 [Ceratopteris richardii]